MHYPNLIRALGLLATVSTAPVFAQTTTWDGDTDSSFNNAANWSNGAPGAANAAIFSSSSALNLTSISVTPNIAPAGITVSSPASNVGIVINGTAAVLNVGASGITLNGTRDLTVTKGTSTSFTFLAVGATQDWNISSGRTLSIVNSAPAGEYDINATGATVTIKGGGTVAVTAANFDIGQTNTNTVVVDGATLNTSTGIRLGQNNTGVGNLTIKSGSVNVGTFVQFGNGTTPGAGASGNLVMEGGSILKTAQIIAAAGAKASTVTFDGATVRATTDAVNLIGSGNFTTSIGDSGLTVDTNGNDTLTGNSVAIAGIMGDKSGEVGVLTKSGLGTLTLSAANTFTGATTVSAGTLALGAAGTLAGTTYNVASGAEFDVSAKSAYSLAGVTLKLGAGTGTSGFFDAGTADLTLGGNLIIDFSTATPDASYDFFGFGTQASSFSGVSFSGAIIGSLALTSTDTWTGTVGGYDWTFSETTGVLSSVSAIPEPSSFAVLAGLGALGAASLRRRRRA
jgi:autotransporter-associated beta strand protein